MSEEAKQALLARAANRFGVAPLAKRLNVKDGLLAAWLTGHVSMPDSALVQLAEMLEKLGDDLE